MVVNEQFPNEEGTEMDYGLHNRTVLVTGGSSGIGRATALAFGREGAKVAITYRRNHEGATDTVKAIAETGGHAIAVRLDLSDPTSIQAAVTEVTKEWGGIHILINNAAETDRHAEAYNPASPAFQDLPAEQWEPQLTAGLTGIFHTLQAVLPTMRAQGWGRIAFVSSAAAERGGPKEQAYAATKAALVGLTSSLARELGKEGILVNIVMPALTTTERVMTAVPEPARQMIAGHLATGQLSSPEDIANAVVFLCSTANGNITNETLRVTGGL